MLLVLIEQNGSKLGKAGRIAISAALSAKETHGYESVVGVLLGGSGTAEAAKEASKYGLDKIVYLEDPSLANYLAGTYSSILIDAANNLEAKAVMSLSGTTGKDMMPRVAQALDAGQSSDTLEFLPNRQYRRPMYAGNVIADIELTTERQVVTVRSTAFDAAVEQGECPVENLDLKVESDSQQQFVSFDSVDSERPELTEAEAVVSGGRALKSEENFKEYIEPLADKLGAAIGASRAAVDSGYAPNDWQVGQTGKVVAPNLYIAIGISGAIQHLAGMKDSKTIVAINKDAEAPIFEIADYGLVADLFDVLPELTEKL